MCRWERYTESEAGSVHDEARRSDSQYWSTSKTTCHCDALITSIITRSSLCIFNLLSADFCKTWAAPPCLFLISFQNDICVCCYYCTRFLCVCKQLSLWCITSPPPTATDLRFLTVCLFATQKSRLESIRYFLICTAAPWTAIWRKSWKKH